MGTKHLTDEQILEIYRNVDNKTAEELSAEYRTNIHGIYTIWAKRCRKDLLQDEVISSQHGKTIAHRNANTKLSDEEVEKIKASPRSQTFLASVYHVSSTTISRIKNGTRRKIYNYEEEYPVRDPNQEEGDNYD